MAQYYARPAVLNPTAAPAGAQKFLRDGLMKGDPNGGVRFLFDLGFPFSWPGGPYDKRPAAGAPVNGAKIHDVTEHGDGDWIAPADQAAFAGNGFDFAAVDARGHELRAPVSSLSSIISGPQHFAICTYVKLPSLDDWYSGTGVAPLFCTTSHGSGYAEEADLCTIGGVTGGVLRAARTIGAISAVETRSVTLDAATSGQFAQVLYWRDSTSSGLRVRTANGEKRTANTTGAVATVDLSNKRPRWGVTNSLWDYHIKPSLLTFRKWRLYRAWIEDLAVSGRSAEAVADADWLRTTARGIFA